MKKKILSLALTLALFLAVVPAASIAADGELPPYNPGDIAAVNAFISQNGLSISQAPADGSAIPDDWFFVIWFTDGTLPSGGDKRLDGIRLDQEGLPALDLSSLPMLKWLRADGNKLTSIDVSGMAALEYLDLRWNQLTELDVSNNAALTTLWVLTNQLTELDISNNPALSSLWVQGNKLTELDVSNNPALTELIAAQNLLTTLDISKNTALNRLEVRENYMGQNPDVSIPGWKNYWDTAREGWLSSTGVGFNYFPQNDPPSAETPSLTNFTKPRTYTPETFTDIGGQWYTDWVSRSYEYGIISGVGNNKFNPAGNLSGAEALTIGARIHSVYKYGSFDAGEEIIQSFKRDGDNWYDMFVAYCKAEGLIGNEFDGKLTTHITRSEMLFAWSKLLQSQDMPKQNTVNSLPDVTSATPYCDAILSFYEAGIISGTDSNGTFAPNNNITRAEAATIFMKLIEKDARNTGKVFG